jgi:hydrogenase maturation protease
VRYALLEAPARPRLTPAAAAAVVAVGRADCGDDAAGALVLEALAGRLPAGVEGRRVEGGAVGIFEAMLGTGAVALVDAARSGRPPGTILRFDTERGPLPASLGAPSSHGLGLPDAIELARALGRLPPRVRVWAIEGARYEPGRPPGAATRRAALHVADEVLAWLAVVLG